MKRAVLVGLGCIVLAGGHAAAAPADEATREPVATGGAPAVQSAAATDPDEPGRWHRDAGSIAWLEGGDVVWRFAFDPAATKPHFHPLGPARGACLTAFKPQDHPWHYGLWFSWKFINGVNYWEEDRATGRSEGTTRWDAPGIEAGPDGAAVIRMQLVYVHPGGREDLRERREIRVSAPTPDGGYTIDWSGDFSAGGDGVLLDRTPLPDEPGGRPWGGYAGLSLRLIGRPAELTMLTERGPVTAFVDERARFAAAAVAANLTRDGADLGGIAIRGDPANASLVADAPWYLVRSDEMYFFNAAVLASGPVRLPAGARFTLRYRIAVRGTAWTVDDLRGGSRE